MDPKEADEEDEDEDKDANPESPDGESHSPDSANRQMMRATMEMKAMTGTRVTTRRMMTRRSDAFKPISSFSLPPLSFGRRTARSAISDESSGPARRRARA